MNLKQIKLGKTEEQTILDYLLVFEESCIYFKICHLKYILVDHNLFIFVVFLGLISPLSVP